jgi:hypothetical protein
LDAARLNAYHTRANRTYLSSGGLGRGAEVLVIDTVPRSDPAHRRFASEDEEGQYYLALLRDGTPEEQVAARWGLARIFEDRGMLAEAADVLEGNLRTGVRDRALYARLAAIYRRQGRAAMAAEALANEARIAVGTGPSSPPRRGRAGGLARLALPLAALALLVGAAGVTVALVGGIPMLGAASAGGETAGGGRGPLAAQAVPADRQTAATATEAPAATSSPAATATPVPTADEAGCAFALGFAELRARIGPDTVGECVAEQEPDGSGNVRQRTTKGILLWRTADSHAVFTNGGDTWINGPDGLQRRPNSERFAWEPDADATPRLAAPAPPPKPPVLPGAVLPAQRVVSYYGNPLSAQMGILGEGPPDQIIPRLRREVENYARVDRGRTARPAIELVTIVAQAGPGSDGMYRLRMDTELIEEVAGWAEQNNFLLILDIQVGRSKVGPEVRSLLPFLRRPYVHLALDPEFGMRPDQKPGEEIGSHDAADVNEALDILAELVTTENLPPKMLLVHRFTQRMLTNHQKIKADPRVQVVIVMDGFGPPNLKLDSYEAFVRQQPVQYAGFKLFYRQDKPLMTPEEVLRLDPVPDVVIYQ